MGAEWARHGMCELAVKQTLHMKTHKMTSAFFTDVIVVALFAKDVNVRPFYGYINMPEVFLS
jgi:hypothetical protein